MYILFMKKIGKMKMIVKIFSFIYRKRLYNGRCFGKVYRVTGWRGALIDYPSGRYRTVFLFNLPFLNT